jgi:tetratricopeptide (TPR) repeat protein
MTNSKNEALRLLHLYQCAVDENVKIDERYQASMEAFYITRTIEWDESCGIPTLQAFFIFLLTRIEFELINSLIENEEEMNVLIVGCEELLPVCLDPDNRCRILLGLVKLYIAKIKENTVENLTKALIDIEKLPSAKESNHSQHKAALIFILTESIKEKIYNFTRQSEFITNICRIEEAFHTCQSSNDELIKFEASQAVGEYFLLTLQGKHIENVERAIKIFTEQKESLELSEFVLTETWCKICEKLGDAHAIRIKGEPLKNIQNALNFYSTAASLADEIPLDKYAQKQKLINTAKKISMLVERNRLDDSSSAITIIKEINIPPKPSWDACYLMYAFSKTYHTNRELSFKELISTTLQLLGAMLHLACSARFHYDVKILEARVILDAPKDQNLNILENRLADFQEILKQLDKNIFPLESIKMHLLCGDILKHLSRSSHQHQLVHYKMALEISEEFDCFYYLAIIYLRIGQIYINRNSHVFNIAQAIEYFFHRLNS